jgi:hypothetical protein
VVGVAADAHEHGRLEVDLDLEAEDVAAERQPVVDVSGRERDGDGRGALTAAAPAAPASPYGLDLSPSCGLRTKRPLTSFSIALTTVVPLRGNR